MEHMVINPSWFVPRSIATKEYLPQLQQNPNAVNHLLITDVNGQLVEPGRRRFHALFDAQLSIRYAAAARQIQRAGAGEVHVPEQTQYLPSRHTTETPLRT